MHSPPPDFQPIEGVTARAHVPLSTLGRWRIGGPADLVLMPTSTRSLGLALVAARDLGKPVIIIGDGTNLLFADEGFRGTVIRIGPAIAAVRHSGPGRIEAEAGLWVPSFVRLAIGAGLGGVIHAIGIPGRLGGLVTMNGGSQRKGIGDHVEWVDAFDRDGVLHRLDRDQLNFGYRQSRLQDGSLVVARAGFLLPHRASEESRREAIAILAARRAKFPRIHANCGSVFVSDPALYQKIGPPGQAIELAGLKGATQGSAQFSPDHANFIVNRGGATARDVLSLIALARDRVAAMTGVAMQAEVRYVAPNGAVTAAHEILGT